MKLTLTIVISDSNDLILLNVKISWLSAVEKMVDATLAELKSSAPEWCGQLASAWLDHIQRLYGQSENHWPLERGFIFQMVGLAVHHGVIPQGPVYAMDLVMSSVRHPVTEESVGCAAAIGKQSFLKFIINGFKMNGI